MDTENPISNPPPGALIATLRDQALLSQRALAERAGIPQSVISRVERGGTVSVELLARLLRPLGLQLRLETEPYVDVIDAELDAEAGRTREERFEEAARRASYDGFDIAAIDSSLAEFPHCYGGLTAAGLLGAPIRMRVCDVLLPSDDETIDRFLVWLDENWARRWDDDEQRYSGMIQLDPRLPGVSRWETPIGRVAATFVDAFPPTTSVTLMDGSYEVVGMTHLDAEDPHAKRVLERVRMRLASTP